MSPARGQPRAGDDRPDWRLRLREKIGEDPGRYLDRPLLVPGHEHDPGEMLKARIRGIDRLDRVNAWIATERRLGRGEDGGPREPVIDLLEQRRAFLQEHGERPQDLAAALEKHPEDIPDRYWPESAPDGVDKGDLTRYDEDGNPYRLKTKRNGTTTEYLDDTSQQTVAADGGDSDAG